jgi:hypothetical protein
VDDVETDETDPTEALRIAIMVVGLALNVWVMWDVLKDRPEIMVAKRRVAMWWDRHVAGPERRAKAMRKAEAETVFEAMGVLDGGD